MKPDEVGRRGEAVAARDLRRRGYRILARRFTAAGGEVDLVGLRGETVIFVEVKTRRVDPDRSSAQRIDREKQRRIARAALVFLERSGLGDCECRFDVALVTARGWRWPVEWIEGAFEA